MMLKYEIRKIFVKKSSKIAVIIILFLIGICCYSAFREVSYVNDKGATEYGYKAVHRLRDAKKEWKGELTTEKLIRVINENTRINNTKEAKSENITQGNIAFGWKQGFGDIREMINSAFNEFNQYDYYRVNSVNKNDVGNLYNNRIRNIKTWLDTNSEKFTDAEKKYLIQQYEQLHTPFYYDYADGWIQLFERASEMIMIMVLILGFLVADIFSGEFSIKADAIFYSTRYGRNKAVKNKIAAGILVATVIYWVSMLIYSGIILGFLGADGANCPIQTSNWKSFYNLTYFQEFILLLSGGYVGTLFILTATMFVSAKTRSTVLAVVVPFIVVFIPQFFTEVSALSKILSLLPDQLLQVNKVLVNYKLYQAGGKVMPALPILLILYLVLSAILCPILYHGYRKTEVK